MLGNALLVISARRERYRELIRRDLIRIDSCISKLSKASRKRSRVCKSTYQLPNIARGH